MNSIVVMNTKGGVGKTTVTTNLASYFGSHDIPTAILDYDPQGSSIHWLRQRSPGAPRIHAASAAQPATGLRGIRSYVPANTQQLIMDAPAGASKLLQQEILQKANYILIPISPSAIDIHATANFIKDLLLVGRVRAHGIQVGVVANRVGDCNTAYAPLERFLASLRIPLLARLSASDIYIEAAERGIGIFEMDEAASARERQEFMPIVDWVRGGCGAWSLGNVVVLPSTRKSVGLACG